MTLTSTLSSANIATVSCDPAQLQLLVRLELPFKTVKGVTIDEVAERLVPTGFYKDATKVNTQYGEHLLLDNIAR